jgi:hypothetical protein
MKNIISNILFYMPHDFILQRIRISISTLSKYIRVKKHKKQKTHICTRWYLHRYKCPHATSAGGQAHFVLDALYRFNTRYKIGYELTHMVIFPVVIGHHDIKIGLSSTQCLVECGMN